MKTGFLFFIFIADHLLVGQLCTNPKSDRSLLSCLKVTQCSTSEIGDAPLYNPCSLPIQVMTTGPLPAPSKCKSGLPRITGTCPGWWKQSFRLRHAPSSGSVSRRWLRLKAATLNRCQLYYIIKLPELIFSIKVLEYNCRVVFFRMTILSFHPVYIYIYISSESKFNSQFYIWMFLVPFYFLFWFHQHLFEFLFTLKLLIDIYLNGLPTYQIKM